MANWLSSLARNLFPTDATPRAAAPRSGLTLYHSPTCIFCLRVQAAVRSLGLQIAGRNILTEPGARRELIQGGGSAMVPCLKIDEPETTRWLYESADIIRYLRTLE